MRLPVSQTVSTRSIHVQQLLFFPQLCSIFHFPGDWPSTPPARPSNRAVPVGFSAFRSTQRGATVRAPRRALLGAAWISSSTTPSSGARSTAAASISTGSVPTRVQRTAPGCRQAPHSTDRAHRTRAPARAFPCTIIDTRSSSTSRNPVQQCHGGRFSRIPFFRIFQYSCTRVPYCSFVIIQDFGTGDVPVNQDPASSLINEYRRLVHSQNPVDGVKLARVPPDGSLKLKRSVLT
eukprot:COSAG02_NODE_3439_length_6743_cov_9.291541_1_plen_235_part_00